MGDDAAAWQFWIDVGGTFTDCVARRPDGRIVTHKLLSNGKTLTSSSNTGTVRVWQDDALIGAPTDYYRDWLFSCPSPDGNIIQRRIERFDAARGTLKFDHPLPAPPATGTRGELSSDEEAPVAGIRWLLGRPLGEALGPVRVRLGTTRATNALLERQGARTALVTTRGFADALRIGNQDRPVLFDLHIHQPPELYETAVEVDERLDADGKVLLPLDEEHARKEIVRLRASGIESLAVCLLHSHRNPGHEERVGLLAASAGFRHVALSSRVSPLPKFVYRGDTTVLDAYLTPLLREYCQRLAAQMPGAEIRYMTSAGSLVAAEAFSGKDAILSGPAGGVVGAARVTERAAATPAFAFDMGGTSTDVSHWDGRAFARRYEMELGGAGAGGTGVRRLRLQSSMLEIETVAAGGGSVCWFDGQMTRVGPHSAGADPGPACYGRGGPLSVTDLNVFLGRVPKFPFQLDHEAVKRRLDEMIAAIRQAGGKEYSRAALAAGFLRVANANMVAPIKKLAAARGEDTRAHTLVAFGGAGGQHACAVARAVGVRRVLCSPYAGVLSALGIGLANVTRFAERALPPGEAPLNELDPIFSAMEESLRGQMAVEGFPDDALAAPRRLLEMRYRGQEMRLTVPQPEDGDFAAEFARQHQRLFRFTFPGRAIEAYAARVELATIPKSLPDDEPGMTEKEAVPIFHVLAFHDFLDEPEETAVFSRADLPPGTRLAGPAIILESVATVVVEPGWTVEATAQGDLLLHDRSPARDSREKTPASDAGADPVEMELFNNRLTSLAEQMGVVLQRTALSTNVKERLDFSCALFDRTGRLIANAAHIPVHLGAMQECVRCLLEDVPRMLPVEAYITNDPFRGGSHLPDVTVVTPVFIGGMSTPVFFTASRAHHAEIGGITPGSLPPLARCLAEEGVLIRAFRFAAADAADSDLRLRACLLAGPYPTRSVEENLADIHAQIAANQTGVKLLEELVTRHGLGRVETYCGHLRAAAEQKLRAALRKLPPGTTAAEDKLDDGTPIRVAITLQPGGSARLDFTGTGPAHPGNLNANRAIVDSAVIFCLRCLLGEPIPLNAGLLAPVEIHIPVGSLLDPPGNDDPAKCPAVGGGNVETSQRLVDVIFRALGVAADSQGTMNNFLFGRGADAANQGAFGYYETIGGGGGAGPGFPGAHAVHTHMTNTRLTDPEILESRYPVRVRQWSIRRGSGGKGRFPGGDGMVREIEFLADVDVSLLTSRRTCPPCGGAGGEPGAPGRNLLRPPGTGEWIELPSSTQFRASKGCVLRLETPGGGGWGRAGENQGRLESREEECHISVTRDSTPFPS